MKYLLLMTFIVNIALISVISHKSKALSYLSDQAEVCANCHVMTDAYKSYKASTHSLVANCNDCHVPQENIFKKYAFKAADGVRHASIFTLGLTPQSPQLSRNAESVVQDNCERCHAHQISELSHTTDGTRHCWTCHRHTPHSRLHSRGSIDYNYPLNHKPSWSASWLSEDLNPME